METLSQVITSVLNLPDIVKWPGLIIVAYVWLRGCFQILGLRFIRAAGSFAWGLAILLILYHWGHDMYAFIETYQPSEPQEPQS